MTFLITVPAEYPLNPLDLTIIKQSKEGDGTNLDSELLAIFEDHMRELIRRYHQGYDGLAYDINEGKIGVRK